MLQMGKTRSKGTKLEWTQTFMRALIRFEIELSG